MASKDYSAAFKPADLNSGKPKAFIHCANNCMKKGWMTLKGKKYCPKCFIIIINKRN